MEAIVMVILIIGLATLGASSLRWGVDSRPAMTDDHIR